MVFTVSHKILCFDEKTAEKRITLRGDNTAIVIMQFSVQQSQLRLNNL